LLSFIAWVYFALFFYRALFRLTPGISPLLRGLVATILSILVPGALGFLLSLVAHSLFRFQDPLVVAWIGMSVFVLLDWKYLRQVSLPDFRSLTIRDWRLWCIFVPLSIGLFQFQDSLYMSGAQLFMKGYAWSDLTYHLSIINSFRWGLNFPPEQPNFSGTFLNYHFLFDFTIAFFSRLGAIPLPLSIFFPH
jgi:hypothetical protein